jgi:hypothetical protein
MVSIFGLGQNDFDSINQTLDMNNNTITNVVSPVNNSDVATKQYVDSQTGASAINKVSKTGDTMSGNLLVNFNTVDSVRTLGCNNLSSGKTFRLYLADISNRIDVTYGQAVGFYSALGINLYKNNTKLVGIGDGALNETSFYSGILMNSTKISNLLDNLINEININTDNDKLAKLMNIFNKFSNERHK